MGRKSEFSWEEKIAAVRLATEGGRKIATVVFTESEDRNTHVGTMLLQRLGS